MLITKLKENKMNFNPKNIPMIITLLILSGFALQACAAPSTGSAIVENEDVSVITEASEESAVVTETEIPETVQGTEAESVLESTSSAVSEDPSPLLKNSLTQSEIDSLVFMREEEKLAHDVYIALYDIWGLNIFQNIANSEQTHTNAVANLLATYNIPDPADTSPAGVFVNADLQALYDELVVWGSQSLGDALKVGGAIEEIDILDLEEALTFIEDSAIQNVYQNLLKGSENHLRAFTSTYERQTGETYVPQYMEADAYEAIVSADVQRGGRGNGRRP
jgi:hypothetical protein